MILKKLLLPLIVLTNLYGSTYDDALDAYNHKDYEKSIILIKSDKNLYKNIEAQLLWARAENQLSNEALAMSAYERVLMLDENNLEASLYLAKIYNKQGLYTQSEHLAKNLNNYQLSPAQRSAVSALLDASSKDINRFRTNAHINIGYDTNVNSNAGAGNLNNFYNDIGLGGVVVDDIISTLFTSYGLNLSYLNELGYKNGFYMQADSNLYGQNNFEDNAKRYNTYFGKASLGLGYKFSQNTFYLPIAYDRLNYLEKDLLQTYSINPILNTILNKNLLSSIKLLYKQRSYIDKVDQKRDDNEYGADFTLYGVYNKNFAYIKLGGNSFSASKKESISYTDKNLFNFSTGVNFILASDHIFSFDYRFRFALFKDQVSQNNLNQRRDIYNNISISYNTSFFDFLQTNINYSYTNNTSNYIPAVYAKNVFSFGLQYNY